MSKVKKMTHTIQLSDKTFRAMLRLKNLFTIKLRTVTNDDVDEDIGNGMSRFKKGVTMENIDFEPEYTFDECLLGVIEMVEFEQRTGEVCYIT